MRPFLQILIIILASNSLLGQSSYRGFIDKYPVELVTLIYSDRDVRAVYAYSKFDEPIAIDGEIKEGKLTLFEKDNEGKNKATLTFDDFDAKTAQLKGTWKYLHSNKQLNISLTKDFDVDVGYDLAWATKEIIQPVSLKNKYFKLVISKTKGDFSAHVTGVKIFEKGTDKLIQHIAVEGQLWGLDSMSVEDYNFDGVPDFSVFEQSYAGPNTSRVYFLYDPKTQNYFKSSYSGTSLEFDQKAKRVYEHNQCCAGRSHMTAEYKIVHNKMILLKRSCLEYDEAKEDFIEIKCD